MRRRDVTVTVTAAAISEKAVITVNQILGHRKLRSSAVSVTVTAAAVVMLLGGADEPRWSDAADHTAAIR